MVWRNLHLSSQYVSFDFKVWNCAGPHLRFDRYLVARICTQLVASSLSQRGVMVPETRISGHHRMVVGRNSNCVCVGLRLIYPRSRLGSNRGAYSKRNVCWWRLTNLEIYFVQFLPRNRVRDSQPTSSRWSRDSVSINNSLALECW